MEDKIEKSLKFYLMATKLKYKIRSGWAKDGWNIKKERIESIAEHVYGVIILAISLDSEFDFNIDLNKVIKMLALHEIGETIIGDITPFDGINITDKNIMEHKAWSILLDGLVKKEEIYNLLMEFDECITNESRFAYLCDKLEADIQSKIYQDMGVQRELTDQENNKCFKYERIQNILNNGAKTAFDVWYQNDIEKFENDLIFKKILNYVKDNNMNI